MPGWSVKVVLASDWNPTEFARVDDAKTSNEFKYKHVKNLTSVAQTTHNVSSISQSLIFWRVSFQFYFKKLSDVVEKAISSSSVPVILGGDHSLAIGSVHGTLKAFDSNIGLIWIDAHADINTPLSSPSGNLHGQPLSFLVKGLEEYMPKLPGFDWITSKYDTSALACLTKGQSS